MKRLTIMFLILALMFTGCTAFNNFLCKPTAAQTEQANIGLAVAQVILVAAASYTGSGVAALVSTQAIPVFQKVIQGYCVVQAEWDAAVSALTTANTQTKALTKVKAFGTMTSIDSDIIGLQGVKW